MQSPQSPYSQPPIPSPDGNLPPATPHVSGDWSNAPKIVKNWAYQLTWVALFFLTIGVIASLFGNAWPSIGEKVSGLVFCGLIAALFIWLGRGLKSGAPNAWVVQIIVSAIGLLFFPLWTIVNIYLLSQWFKPETKAWFGKS